MTQIQNVTIFDLDLTQALNQQPNDERSPFANNNTNNSLNIWSMIFKIILNLRIRKKIIKLIKPSKLTLNQ